MSHKARYVFSLVESYSWNAINCYELQHYIFQFEIMNKYQKLLVKTKNLTEAVYDMFCKGYFINFLVLKEMG